MDSAEAEERPKKKRRKISLETGLNYQYKMHNDLVPHYNIPLRKRIYDLFPVGSTASTNQILQALYKSGYTVTRQNLSKSLMKAVRAKQISRVKIKGAGANGMSTEVLWTFLERPVYIYKPSAIEPVQPDPNLIDFLEGLKKTREEP